MVQSSPYILVYKTNIGALEMVVSNAHFQGGFLLSGEAK